MNKRIVIAAAVILSIALYLNISPFHDVIPLKKAFIDFPLSWKGWEGNDFYFDDAILDKLRATEYISREYTKDADSFGIYIGYYSAQKEGAQIHSPKHCLPGGGWVKLSERKRKVNIDKVGEVSFIEAVYKKGNEKEIFAYWYKMKNAYITNEYVLKLYMIVNSIKYRRNDAAFIRLSAQVTMSEEHTVNIIDKAMNDFLPLLQSYLPE